LIRQSDAAVMTTPGDGEDDLEYDLAFLMATDAHPFDEKAMLQSTGKCIKTRAKSNVQRLVNKLFMLEKKNSDRGPMLLLPEPILRMPREKPVPEPKAESRWEKFAKERGITKRKRDRMVWDDDTGTWRPRFGYKRDGAGKDWLIPLKKTDPDHLDKFEEKRLTKKQAMNKNTLNRIKNLDRADRQGRKSSSAPAGIPTALEFPHALKGDGEKATRSKRGMQAAKASLQQVQHSTASMGQFDRRVEGEGKRGKGQRRQFLSNHQQTKTRDMQLMQLTLGGNLSKRRDGGGQGKEVKKKGRRKLMPKNRKPSTR